MLSLLTRAASLAALSIVLIAMPVAAHAELVSATPGPDEVVTSPEAVVASFNQDLDPSRTSIAVRDSAGETVARGGEVGDTPREWRLELPALSPGTYEVRYTSFSAEDGELHRGSYSFSVIASEPSPQPTPAPSSTPRPSETPAPPTDLPVVTASPTALPSPSPSPSATPTATPQNGDDITGGSAMNVALPIVVGLVLVGALGWVFMRRRSR